MTRRTPALLLAVTMTASVVLLAPAAARATAPTLLGFGARNVALAQSNVADASPAFAAYVNPAFAAEPGTRVAMGYGHGWTRLKIDGDDAPVRAIAGTDLAIQLGGAVGRRLVLGGALSLHLPDRSLARVAFTPGTEPAFVRFDPSPQRTTAEAVVSLCLGRLALGVGSSVLVSAEGRVDFSLGQDGAGTYADGQTDVSLPYDVAPIAGIALDLGAAGLGFRYRGAQAIHVDLRTAAKVDVQGNPLNGTTAVTVSGASGYVPSTFDLAARWSPTPTLRLMSALQLARWSRAPSPVAELTMDIALGLTPGQREGRFVHPAYRDTLSPRLGLEVSPEAGPHAPWTLRAGYAFTPSPVPESRGFASPADASTDAFSLGAGLPFGSPLGVELRMDAAVQLVALRDRVFDKGDDTLPFATYQVGGRVVDAHVTVEGTWR